MIIFRDKLFSKSLPDSRIGIGWIQDKNDKIKSEKYLKVAKDAADKGNIEGEDEEKLVKRSKNAATKAVLSDELPVPVGKAIGGAGIAYGVSKFPVKSIEILKNIDPRFNEVSKYVESIGKFTKKHSGKIAGAVGAGTLIYHLPKLKKKVDSARLGAEINTRDRVRKSNKK